MSEYVVSYTVGTLFVFAYLATHELREGRGAARG